MVPAFNLLDSPIAPDPSRLTSTRGGDQTNNKIKILFRSSIA